MDDCRRNRDTELVGRTRQWGRGMASPDAAELFDELLINQLAGGSRRVDRAWLTDRGKVYLDDGQCRIVLLTGGPGTGKSAVMAHLAQERQDWPRYFIRRIGETDTDA